LIKTLWNYASCLWAYCHPLRWAARRGRRPYLWYAAAADDSELCERRVPAAGHTYGTPPAIPMVRRRALRTLPSYFTLKFHENFPPATHSCTSEELYQLRAALLNNLNIESSRNSAGVKGKEQYRIRRPKREVPKVQALVKAHIPESMGYRVLL